VAWRLALGQVPQELQHSACAGAHNQWWWWVQSVTKAQLQVIQPRQRPEGRWALKVLPASLSTLQRPTWKGSQLGFRTCKGACIALLNEHDWDDVCYSAKGRG